jgi:hypothetical protein
MFHTKACLVNTFWLQGVKFFPYKNCWCVPEFVVDLTGFLEHARRVTPLNLSFLKHCLVH